MKMGRYYVILGDGSVVRGDIRERHLKTLKPLERLAESSRQSIAELEKWIEFCNKKKESCGDRLKAFLEEDIIDTRKRISNERKFLEQQEEAIEEVRKHFDEAPCTPMPD
jgi:hypothetical protein